MMEELKAHRNIYVCDQGHYGSTTCSNCRADIEGEYIQCSKCKAFLDDKPDISYNMGGSDFI